MKIKSFILLLAIAFFLASVSLFAQEKPKEDKKKTKFSQVKKVKDEKSEEKLMCAVMKEMAAKKNINYTYKGKKYYFCCKDCIAKFKKEPEKYIKGS